MTLDDALEQKWLAVTVGDDEAVQAMSLPRELRRSLYGDVLRLGPAANEVDKMLGAVKVGLVSHLAPQLFELLDSLGWSNSLNEPLGGLNAPKRSIWATACKDGYEELEQLLATACAINQKGATYSGTRVLGLMLNGQYVFHREDIAMNSVHITKANQILSLLDLPPLHGVFTPPPKNYSRWSYNKMYG